jgi:WD40 repeat protein
LQETDPITSIHLSEDSRYALANLCTQEIHLWDLMERRIIKKYTGQKQGRFVIRSCFGGYQQGFVLAGSEDSNIYVWHRDRAELLLALPGHSGK